MTILRKTTSTGAFQKRSRVLGEIGTLLKTAQLADSPAALYMLDEPAGSTLPQDSTGNGRHMTGAVANGTFGNLPIISGPTSARLTGGASNTNHLGYAPSASWMAGANGVFTAECLFYLDGFGDNPILMARYGNADTAQNTASWLLIAGTAGLYLYARYDTASVSQASGGGALPTGTPLLATVTYDYANSLIRTYVNGVQTSTAARATGVRANGAFTIGGDYLDNAHTALIGRISNVALWGSTLTPTQILNHAKAAGLA